MNLHRLVKRWRPLQLAWGLLLSIAGSTSNAAAAPLCFTTIQAIKVAMRSNPALKPLAPLVSTTSFTGHVTGRRLFVPFDVPCKVTIVDSQNAIVMSIHITNPKKDEVAPEQICIDQGAFTLQDGGHKSPPAPFTVNATTREIMVKDADGDVVSILPDPVSSNSPNADTEIHAKTLKGAN